MKAKQSLTFLAMALALLVGAGACSGGDDDDRSASGPTTKPSASGSGSSTSTTSDSSTTTESPSSATTTTATADRPDRSTTSGTSGTGTGSGPGDEPGAPGGIGSAGVGDEYFPELGNGGYDVEHYDLDLTYDPQSNELAGTVTIEAESTDDLRRFNLDLLGMEVTSVSVDRRAARFVRDGAELVITPSDEIARGHSFETVVEYEGVPEPSRIPGIDGRNGWLTTPEGAITLNEPDGARTWFPGNDHPSDKAIFTVHVTIPSDLVAVASGQLVSSEPGVDDDTTTWTFEAADPMATYLLQVAIGDFVIEEAIGPDGLALRHVFSRSLADEARPAAANTVEHLEILAEAFGPYPFETYGILVPLGAPSGLALETQTLSLIPPDTVGIEEILVHELAHQWFGDAVSPQRWRDIWLNEGFATYAEWIWEAGGDGSVDAQVSRAYSRFEAFESSVVVSDPGREAMFGVEVYARGALTLHALRVVVGDDAFFEILQTWVADYGGRSATTDDFIDLAEQVSGDDLADVFEAWLDETDLPPKPR